MKRGPRAALVGASALAIAVAASCAGSDTSRAESDEPGGGVARYDIEVVREIPREPDAFTQGLLFDDAGQLWESTGLRGESSLRRVDPATGEVVEHVALDDSVFGEGLAIGPHGLVQLTWTEGIAYRWSLDRAPLGEFRYEGEGWGLTFDGASFIQSDGSSTLTFRDPETFVETSSVDVRLDGEPIDQLNELEWVNGQVLANVWHSEEIVAIDPTTGSVSGVIDASGLWESPERSSEMTLNGIAHRPGDPPHRLWLTGKNWPSLFVVDVVEAP